jgi:hypothetical protein
MATLITFCFRGGVIVSGKKKVPVHPGLSHYYILSNNVSAPLPGKIKKEEELIGVVDFHFSDRVITVVNAKIYIISLQMQV